MSSTKEEIQEMKSSVLIAVGVALAWFASPVACRAQSEVAPDHFEMTGVEPFAHAAPVTAQRGMQQRHLRAGVQTSDQNRASLNTLQKASSQEMRLQFEPPAATTKADVRNSAAAKSQTRQAIERLWTRAVATLRGLWPRDNPVHRS
jgi:hypothetical protein